MQQFYTLEQAAQVLRTTPDKVKDMARKGELRAFQDRGTMRFRSQEVDERARALGLGSDVDLPLGDLPPPSKSGSSSGAAGRRTTQVPKGGETFDVLGDDVVPLGESPPMDKTGSRAGSPSSASRRKSPSPSKSPP